MKQIGSNEKQSEASFFKFAIGPFVFNGQQITSIANTMAEFASRPAILVECMDATRHFDNIQQFVEYENARKRRIVSFRLESSIISHHVYHHVHVETGYTRIFLLWGYSYMVLYVRGPEEKALSTKQKLDEIIQGCRSWQSLAFHLNIIIILLLSVSLSLFVVVTLPVLKFKAFWSLVMPIISTAVISNIFHFLFPSWNLFLIGQGKVRHKRRKTIQKAIGVIVLGVLAGVIGNWLYLSIFGE